MGYLPRIDLNLLSSYPHPPTAPVISVNGIPLKNMVRPVYTGEIIAAEQLANINGRGGVEGVLESFAIVRDMGYLPRYELDLWPFDRYPPTPEMISVNGTQQMSRQPELVPA